VSRNKDVVCGFQVLLTDPWVMRGQVGRVGDRRG
jgi:hypothetical protein